MTSHAPESIALMLVAEGKGIVAADETVPVDAAVPRRTYREMLFTSRRHRAYQRCHYL
jgi:fructose-bisphosphate aldolase class 1